MTTKLMNHLAQLLRLHSKVVFSDSGCWEWQGAKYPTFYIAGKYIQAYRFAYNLRHRYQVPQPFEMDHLCRNPRCINPDHLEPVTHRENVARGISPNALNIRKTHCSRNHPLSGDNLHIRPKGNRRCLACERLYSAKAKRKKRAAKNARST